MKASTVDVIAEPLFFPDCFIAIKAKGIIINPANPSKCHELLIGVVQSIQKTKMTRPIYKDRAHRQLSKGMARKIFAIWKFKQVLHNHSGWEKKWVTSNIFSDITHFFEPPPFSPFIHPLQSITVCPPHACPIILYCDPT